MEVGIAGFELPGNAQSALRIFRPDGRTEPELGIVGKADGFGFIPKRNGGRDVG